MDEFFAGLSGFFGEWGWLFILIGGVLVGLVVIWWIILAVFVGGSFASVKREFRKDRW